MDQEFASSPALKPEDNWSHCLPGFRLTHTLHLVSDVNLDVVSRAAAHLKEQHAPVHHWAVVKRGTVLEQRIDLDDISEQQARVLREHLLTLKDVLRVRLEHRFVRRETDAAGTAGTAS
ncbi:hypothetical protein LFL96_23945 [Paraburkholderia sp. D15]|uniref:hypothetical protein n=1 Tax=Paraburkholderia sp. D15 TaxID=2880218 RepID=UPI002478677F|nr:hypothetical protein [Paraburkholderia sp. D15]WGS54089.1 hypothetical protein LFL96_23945 [Paraburkholderia sp. D15]